MKEVVRFVKFGLFSLSAGLIEIGVFTLLTEFSGFRYWSCYLFALVLSVIWNLTFNRKFTFRSSFCYRIALFKVIVYYAVFTPISTIGGDYFVEVLGFNDYVVTILIMIINFVTEFLYQRYYIFKNSIDTNKGVKNNE